MTSPPALWRVGVSEAAARRSRGSCPSRRRRARRAAWRRRRPGRPRASSGQRPRAAPGRGAEPPSARCRRKSTAAVSWTSRRVAELEALPRQVVPDPRQSDRQASEPRVGRRNALQAMLPVRTRRRAAGRGEPLAPRRGGAARRAPRAPAPARARRRAPGRRSPPTADADDQARAPRGRPRRRAPGARPSMTTHMPAAAWKTPEMRAQEDHRRDAQGARREDGLPGLHERRGDRERHRHAHHAPVEARRRTPRGGRSRGRARSGRSCARGRGP